MEGVGPPNKDGETESGPSPYDLEKDKPYFNK